MIIYGIPSKIITPFILNCNLILIKCKNFFITYHIFFASYKSVVRVVFKIARFKDIIDGRMTCFNK